MTFYFSTNIADIAKGFLITTLIILAIIFVPRVVTKLDNIGKPIDETTIERIATNVVKIHLEESNKELRRLIKQLRKEDSKAIKEALDNNETIKEIGIFIASLSGNTEPSPDIIITPSGDSDGQRDLEEFIVKRKDADGKEFPTGIIYHSPNVKEGPKFSYQQFPLDFKANIVSSEKGEEDKRYVEFWVENNFVSTSKGNKYSLEMSPEDVYWARAKANEKRFDWWNPRFNLGSSFNTNIWYPNLGISLFSYGRTKRDMDWTFIDFSLGGDSNNAYVGFTLFEYNLGNFIPLVENLFGGPNVTWGISTEDETQDSVSYGLKFSVPF